MLLPSERLPGTGFRIHKHIRLDEFQFPMPNVNLTTSDVVRWKMAWQARASLESQDRDFNWFYDFIRRPSFRQRCKDFPSIDRIKELPIMIGFSSATLVYGGLHALAWFAEFSSPTEQLLWRISASAVMGGLPTIFAINRLIDLLRRRNYPFNRFASVLEQLELLIYPIALAYVLARAYLVVECFISLSHMPAGVYNVPDWAAYFPHIS